ncbi:Uncharacterized protein FWK35_00032333, partial [Aphis craccivora]
MGISKTHHCKCLKFFPNVYASVIYIQLNLKKFRLLDSERSEECIDFTMIITSRNNAPISNYGGGFRCKSEYPWCIE